VKNATVLTFERRDTAVGAKPTLAFSQISTFEGILRQEFAASGNSPTRSDGPDFRCANHGSLFLLFSLTQHAHSWIEEHLPEDAQWFGNAVVIEHRYIWTILDGIQDAGLAVTRG
jgi:hypothetical protein